MTAGAVITRVQRLRPSEYTDVDMLRWLRRLDMQIYRELLQQHELPEEPEEPAASYTAETELLAEEPYDEELYESYLFAQIDLNNAEIDKYDQSATLFSAAWQQLAGYINRRYPPKNRGGWRL